MDMKKKAQMIRVVELYYLQNMTQQEIADTIGVSRPTITRLLDDAKTQGLIEIKLNIAEDIDVKISNQIRKRLGIKEVIVVDTHEKEEELILEKTARMAAEYLSGVIKDNDVIGISWGSTMNAVVNAMEPRRIENLKVVQLAGGMGEPNSQFDGSSVAFNLAAHLSGSCHCIFGPAILSNEHRVKELEQVPAVHQVMELASKANIYLTGIGAIDEYSSLSRAGYLSESERKALVKEGAAAHLLARILKKDGSELTEFNQRVLAIPLNWLKGNNLSIGVAATARKAGAVCASARGGYLDVLIIDKSCAQAILDGNGI